MIAARIETNAPEKKEPVIARATDPTKGSTDDLIAVTSLHESDFIVVGKLVMLANDDTREILRANLTPTARADAFRLRNLVNRIAHGLEEFFVAQSDGGGVSLQFSSSATEREIVFVIPTDGSVLYFIAREREATRMAGIARGDPGVVDLAQWAATRSHQMSSRDLDIG